MEIQKIFSEINTDERLYSVLLSEDELALFSELQKEKEKKSKIRQLGKAAAIGGGVAALSAGIGENILIDKAVKKAAEKHDLIKSGFGGGSRLIGFGGGSRLNAQDATNSVVRAIKQNKTFKRLNKIDKGGLALAALGTGAYLYGRHKDKKKKEN